MSSGMYFLALIFCLLCGGGLDIFMAATCYKEGKYFGIGAWLTVWVTLLLICLGRIIIEY